MLISMKFAIQQRESLALHFAYAAVIDLPHDPPRNVRLGLATLKLVRKELGLQVECRLKCCGNWRRLSGKSMKLGKMAEWKTPPVGIKNVRAKGLMKRLKGVLSERFVVVW
jgi:hypothetical protein